ncbi:MAG: hypothetical protein Q8P88_03220 [Candidatus Jorgensenbacteria bacterium]|nr:hypothetical protein [Candidatus Jorgensenbacteria bacterium]
MDELNQNHSSAGPAMVSPGAPKSKFWKFAAAFVGIVIVAGAVLWALDYFSPEARGDRESQLNYQKYEKAISDMEEVLRADTYGGTTPQETLDLFVDALRKGDVELASKYFSLEDGVMNKELEDKLRKVEESGKLDEIGILLSSAVPVKDQELDGRTFWFSIYNASGNVEQLIEMSFNSFSKVWKIQSL